MFTYSSQYPSINTKFYTPRYISPTVRETNIPILIPLPKWVLEDFGKGGIPPLVTSFWQALKIQNIASKWGSLIDFYNFLVDTKTSPQCIWSISEKLQNENIGNLFSFKKWQDIRLALSEGNPVMIGGSAYASLKDAEYTGLVPMPLKNEKIIGGLITTTFAYDGETDFVRGLSSIGDTFGKEGTLLFRGSYMRNLLVCRDFFTFIPRIN